MNIYQKSYHYLISKQEENILEELVSELSNDHNISFDNKQTFDFKKFETLQHYSEVKTLSSMNINYLFQILIINTEHHFIGGKYGDSIHNENQILGRKKLKQDFGKILIREKTVFDKILEIFNKTEINFKDDEEFSDRFFVVSDNENQARKFLNLETRKALKSILRSENFIIEISNNELIIGNKKPINKFTLYQIIDFFNNNI